MQKKTINQEILVEKCPICKKEIIGTTENQIKYNLKIHTDAKHK